MVEEMNFLFTQCWHCSPFSVHWMRGGVLTWETKSSIREWWITGPHTSLSIKLSLAGISPDPTWYSD